MLTRTRSPTTSSYLLALQGASGLLIDVFDRLVGDGAHVLERTLQFLFCFFIARLRLNFANDTVDLGREKGEKKIEARSREKRDEIESETSVARDKTSFPVMRMHGKISLHGERSYRPV